MELLKLGVIGLDISHVETFARIFNCPGDPLSHAGSRQNRQGVSGRERKFQRQLDKG